MKRLIVFCAAALYSLILFADPVSKQDARNYAERFIEIYFQNSVRVSDVKAYSIENGTVLYYSVSLDSAGWILVSGDDIFEPVIAYSLDSPLLSREKLEESAKFWFEKLDRHMLLSLNRTDLTTNRKWKDIHTLQYSKSIQYVEPVAPLIDVKWDQGSGWNRFCPEDPDGPNGHVWVGCVAVSMAQAMSYYSFPAKAVGEHGYQPEGYSYQYVNYDEQAPYDWEGMSASSSDNENARLLYHLAVAVNMDFGPDGSGASTSYAPTILKKYFGYSESLVWKRRENFDDVAWNQLVMDELYAGRPLIYAGDGGPTSVSGHAFNVDGIGTDGSFHLNWGWSGAGNGYYTLDALTPGGDHDYSYGQGAVFGFKPPAAGPYDILLENASVFDKQPVGTEVGAVLVSDEVEGNVYTYSLLGAYNFLLGRYGPANFYVEDGILKTSKVFDSEENDSEFLIIRVSDASGNSFSKQFDIEIKKFYYGPGSINLSNASAQEGKEPGFFVGVVNVDDDIAGNSYTFSFLGGYELDKMTESACFYVRRDSLFTNKVFDRTEGELYYAEITLQDIHEHTLVDTMIIEITESLSGGTGHACNSDDELTFYPNPARSMITVEFPSSWLEAGIQLYDINGRICWQGYLSSGESIDVSYFSSGMYCAVIKSKKDRFVKRLVISE